ncbi:BnaC03g69970D [Brassica napus]|uniref:(rape) hypothetical protein n=3 Tax=Brassica napus TaxID=3708 RepID=A0A078FCA2_BRANA|nr:unnamed protein product [Brassica napus]CDY10617.1 BnaC03g69970D [Brassica napus]
MANKISRDILRKLSLTPSNNFEEYVGIKYHIEVMSSLLQLDSEEVRMCGICGTSGVGKTIIARALFNNLSSKFQSSVYLDRAFFSKCGEGYGRPTFNDYNMKLHLQRKFLSEIMDKKDMKIGPMEERLKHQKVLIFIDGVDDPHALNAVAGQTRWFGSGSRIIVVTNDRRVLEAHGIGFRYEVDLPSPEDALQIFCQAAFKQNSPPDGLKEFASEVVELAGRHPLGLNTLGLTLRGLSKEDCLKKLPSFRTSLNGGIEKTLKVSCDGLDSEDEDDKKLFHYIVSLFDHVEDEDIEAFLDDIELSMLLEFRRNPDGGIETTLEVNETTLKVSCDKKALKVSCDENTLELSYDGFCSEDDEKVFDSVTSLFEDVGEDIEDFLEDTASVVCDFWDILLE